MTGTGLWHSWRLYSAILLGDYAARTMAWLISHSVILSWHRANHSFPYPHNAVFLRSSIMRTFLDHWFDSIKVRTFEFESPDLPKQGEPMLNSFGHPVWSSVSLILFQTLGRFMVYSVTIRIGMTLPSWVVQKLARQVTTSNRQNSPP